MENQNSSSNEKVPAKLDALRRAQMASAALDEGKAIPEIAKKPRKSTKSTSDAAKTAQGENFVPGMVYSRTGKPGKHVPASARPSDHINIQATNTLSAFQRLKMGQIRLGLINARDSDAEAVKALEKDVFEDINRDAKIAHLLGIVEGVCRYYKSSPEEVASERLRIQAMNLLELDEMTRAYDFANNQVLIMTDELHAQKVARESTKEMRNFYEGHAVSEIQAESERTELMNRAISAKNATRRTAARP